MSLESVSGIGPKTAERLIAGGITTIDQLSVQRPQEVASICGFSLKIAKDVINDARDKAFSNVEVYTGNEYKDKLKTTLRYFPTGSTNLDKMLGGRGWQSLSTYGLFGLFSTGKTQAINNAVVSCLSEDKYVLVEETETNTFNPSRWEEIANSRGSKIDLDKVILFPATQVGTVFAQFRGYEYLNKKALDNGWDVGLIAIDSFTAKFRRAYGGREMYPERAQEFGRHIDYLEEMAKRFNAVVLLSFQCGVTPDESGQTEDKMRYQGDFYPYGGTLVTHNINTWISLTQCKGGEKSTDVYKANLVDNSWLPKGSCQFIISDRGIEDF